MFERAGGGVVAPALLALVVLAAGTMASVARPSSPAPLGADLSAPTTPVLSLRRVPAVIATAVADARLVATLDQVLADPVLGAGRGTSCLVVGQGSRPIYRRRDDLRLIPASNMKLLTAVAALDRLTPAFRFITEVRTAVPASGGVVDGSLHLIGAGDPILSTRDYAASLKNAPVPTTPLERLAEAVADAGITEVRGGVVGDESRYDSVRFVPTWKRGYVAEGAVGPMSALSVNDGWSSWRPFVPASAPARNAASVLTAQLRAQGITVRGEPSEGPAPADGPALATVQSDPLDTIIGEMLRESDNMTAELLLKELGASKAAGTTAAGIAVVKEVLTDRGLPAGDLTAVDGSGLDRADRATCRLIDGALVVAGDDGAISEGLSVANRTGTLKDRFVGNPAAGKLRAKTGALNNVVALSGWMPVGGQRPLRFSMLANEIPSEGIGRGLQERLGAALAAYPDEPDLATLGPR